MRNYKRYSKDLPCEYCGIDLELDDIDYNFNGCQDEYCYCKKCGRGVFIKVRYGKICKVEYSVEGACSEL